MKPQKKQRSVLYPLALVSHHSSPSATTIRSASGLLLKTSKGEELIDGGAGLWCVNVGYGHPRMVHAARKAIEKLSYATNFGGLSNEPMNKLADKLLYLLHKEAGHTHFSQIFFASSGSDANDSALKIIRYYQQLRGNFSKTKILALNGGYHGLTVSATKLTGINAYKIDDPKTAEVIHLTCPHFLRNAYAGESEEAFTDRLLSEAAQVILSEGRDTIAALIMEPVLGVAGVIIPPRDYLKRLSQLLQANDILFIADEIITGLGRTGKWFGTHSNAVKPDIMTMSKGLTGGYFPLSVCAISRPIIEALSKGVTPFMHGFTFSGHPVGAELGLTTIDILEKEGLVDRAQAIGAYLHICLKQRLGSSHLVKDIRHIGQMHAIEYIQTTDNPKALFRRVSAYARESGLLCRPHPYSGVNSLSPAFTCTKDEAEEIVERLGRAVDKASLS